MENILSRHFQKRLCNAQRQINACMRNNNWRMNYYFLLSAWLRLAWLSQCYHKHWPDFGLSMQTLWSPMHESFDMEKPERCTHCIEDETKRRQKEANNNMYTLNSLVQKNVNYFHFCSLFIWCNNGHWTLYTVHHNITM